MESSDPSLTVRESSRGVKAVLGRLRSPGTAPVPKEIADIVREVRGKHPKSDARQIVKAYELALVVHEGQTRKSGDPFISHPTGVARILSELGMDATTVVAAFLHDSVEDTELELKDLRDSFGDEVAGIIDGLTKIERIGLRSPEQEQAGNLRKMIVAMAGDPRVLIIKLADRLHNMRTLEPLDSGKRRLISRETLDIYAPLAHRLGMQQLKSELEDLAFKYLHPQRYAAVEQMVLHRQPAREQYLENVVQLVNSSLKELKVKAEVIGRPKHYYSIYEKMIRRGRDFDEIFDLVGVRILVDSISDCWVALGAVHSLWTPVPARLKDYIAVPKFNLYQSLHTTVVGPDGKPLEIQIRTRSMHRVAEKGIAAHWAYKESKEEKPARAEDHTAWMQRMLEHKETEDDSEFLKAVRLDLYVDEVFVFTPKGDVVELPKGATPIDFAYSIHTEVGHSCVGSRVNGKLVPLSYQLSSGEIVEVLTSKTARPSRDWIDAVATPRARTKIKQWFTRERREEAIAEGRDALIKALRRAGLSVQSTLAGGRLEEIVAELRYANLEALWVEIGEGRLSAQSIVTKLVREQVDELEDEEEDPLPQPRLKTRPRSTEGVIVKGVDDLWVKLARCCMPVPGDPITGFVTRGRGVSIHRQDCQNAGAFEPERLLEVEWDPAASGVFLVEIQVEALDRPKLLRDVTTTISDMGMNILSATSSVGSGIALLKFTFELADPSQLKKMLDSIRSVDAVYDAYRITPTRA